MTTRPSAISTREQILAMQVTQVYPGRKGKERILDTYLNLIYYGNGSYGIKAAAANYFGLTDLTQMTIAQAAFLAALPQAPSFYDPYQNPEGPRDAMRKRNEVLGAMLAEGYITPREHAEAVATTWEEMNPSRVQSVLREPQFSFRVQREAEAILASLGVEDPALAVRTGGYRIISTLDFDLQQVAHEEVRNWVAALADKNVNNGALVSIDSSTGEIIAYVGSVDYYNREDPRVQGQFDVAGLGRRQPGSAFKPITYASAFVSRDATVATMFVDTLTEFGLGGASSYRPTNADIREHGPVLATDALRYSLGDTSVAPTGPAAITMHRVENLHREERVVWGPPLLPKQEVREIVIGGPDARYRGVRDLIADLALLPVEGGAHLGGGGVGPGQHEGQRRESSLSHVDHSSGRLPPGTAYGSLDERSEENAQTDRKAAHEGNRAPALPVAIAPWTTSSVSTTSVMLRGRLPSATVTPERGAPRTTGTPRFTHSGTSRLEGTSSSMSVFRVFSTSSTASPTLLSARLRTK